MALIDHEITFIQNKRIERILIFFGIPVIVGALLGLMILNIPLEYLVFVLGGLIFVYLVLFHIEIAIFITLLIQNQLGRFNYLGGDTPYHPNGIIGLLLIAGGFLYFLTHKIDYSRLKAIGGFFAFILFSSFTLVNAGIYLMDGITILLRLLAAFSIFAVLSHKLESTSQVKWVIGVIIAAQILPTISGLINNSGLTGLFFTDQTMRLGNSGVGVYLSVISLLCITFFFSAKNLHSYIFWGALTALFLVGLFLSFGRSGWIGMIFGLLLMATIRYKKLVFVLPLVLILIIVLVPGIGQRFQDIQISDLGGEGQDTFSGRIRLWQGALAVFKDNPIFGVGIGLGRYHCATYLGENPGAIHNDYLSALCETGIIGFIIFLVWHYMWLLGLIRSYQILPSGVEKTMTFAALIVFSSIMVMRITDNILLDTYDMYPLCAMMAGALALPRIQKQETTHNINDGSKESLKQVD